ncbi:hypothetical protein SAMN06296416_105231 [Pseudoxanthomonas wuyuanensis]|uniref:Uncharacterized protein n=2 Tax=Pseudoxanthomonas wuyuanensis TaxID=1073196 RepID=A0A286D8H3_9GAMM|nr:hypothetical protein [Pseudoxanthomonas wuyuanensis]KAF1720232.1 hypothetical protein CSC75_11720 [Pseudoxanthomonas wuyuanensis]SOD54958.1 hypothetical protein SAMN06296416_105231 [Pseudoxanthomonas wuyuanensis]
MPSPNPASNGTGTIVPNEFPLRFDQHNFEAHCYNTIGCSVFYAGVYQIKKAPQEVSPAPKTADYQRNWGGALHIGIVNFPEPATVKWQSSDGQAHQADIDIGAIFKDQIILHNVPEKDVPEGAKIVSPSILLEVDDRTIRVYMKAHIPTRQLQSPGNRYSDFRDDLILAWSDTY